MTYTSFIPYGKACKGPRAELGKRQSEAVMRKRWMRDSAVIDRVLQLRDRLDRALIKKQ